MKKPTNEELEDHPEVRDMMDDLGKASAIQTAAKSEGGQLLVEGLTADVAGCVDTLCARYSEFTVTQFVALCADMKSKIDLLRVLTRAPKNKKELELLIQDTLAS